MKSLALHSGNVGSRRQTGFTLVELLVSLGICTLLIVCLNSSLTLTLRSATPPSDSPVLAHIRTGRRGGSSLIRFGRRAIIHNQHGDRRGIQSSQP